VLNRLQSTTDPLSLSLVERADEPISAPKPDDSRWTDPDQIAWQRDLLALFARNQIRVALALPVIALLFAAASLMWTSLAAAGVWLACTLAAQAVQLHLCRHYERSEKANARVPEWIGMLVASELLYASSWSLPLFLFWQDGNDLQHIYLIATLMTVVAVRIMIANNFMPVVIAGTGFITLAIAVRCLIEAAPLYVALGAMAVVVEVFFIQLAMRLQETARDMLIFKAQRERLIDELNVAREQAEASRVRAEEASRAKSRFLATMSHELRTPLNAIMGFSEILSHEMMGPHAVSAYKSYSNDIHHSGNYLMHLINDILDLSRIEAGRVELKEKAISVTATGEQCANLLRLRVREKKQTLKLDLPADMPDILGDERSLRQIWLNLLSNAVKFTPHGGHIEMAVRRHDNGALALAVNDTGPGIPKHELEAAMGAFTRGSLATRHAIDGAGLGLPIVNGLAKLHGAELQLKSRKDGGTEAIVVFPPRRVLDGPRAELLAGSHIQSESQRKLIALTA
jgi:two-component system cell cycle sensor histidine kinase PleC